MMEDISYQKQLDYWAIGRKRCVWPLEVLLYRYNHNTKTGHLLA